MQGVYKELIPAEDSFCTFELELMSHSANVTLL